MYYNVFAIAAPIEFTIAEIAGLSVGVVAGGAILIALTIVFVLCLCCYVKGSQ